VSASAEYVEYIEELLSGFPDLRTKKYFGGIAFRSSWFGNDIQFATILDDVLYFVVDDETRPKYEAKGMTPFTYNKQNKIVIVKKWYAAPEELFDNAELMKDWAMEALETAVGSS